MKNRVLLVAFGVLFLVASGCKTTEAPDIDLGTQTVGPYSVHVNQETGFAVNETSKFAILTSGGPGKADSVVCWYGAATTTTGHVDGAYDSGDGDWDCLVPIPATTMATDRMWFTITVGGAGANGSVVPQP